MNELKWLARLWLGFSFFLLLGLIGSYEQTGDGINYFQAIMIGVSWMPAVILGDLNECERKKKARRAATRQASKMRSR